MKSAFFQGTTARRITSIGFITVILVAAAIPTIARNATTNKDTQDFGPIYHAAQAMLHGQNIYAATTGLYIYPPFLAFIFQPLALLPEHAAAIVWVFLSGLLILLGARLTTREMTGRWLPSPRSPNPFWGVTALGILLAAEKIHADFRLGQTDCLMILGFACILRWMETRPWMAGFCIGATANMKYLSLIFVPYFLLKRNFRAALASIVSFALFMIIPAVEVGLREATRFAASAVGALVKMTDLAPQTAGHGMKIPRASWPRSVSITSAITRFTRTHAMPDWAGGLLLLVILALVLGAIICVTHRHGVVFFRADTAVPSLRRRQIATLEWATLIVLALTFSPQTTARHMVLLLLVYIAAIVVCLVQDQRGQQVAIIAALIITSLGLSFPPRESGMEELLWVWRGIAGASLCALSLLLVMLFYGSLAICKRMNTQLGEKASPAAEA